MTVHADPYAQAKRVSTNAQAARLKASLESELALNDNLPLGWESQAERGLEHLGEHFPDAEHSPAYEEAPSLSRGAKNGLTPKQDAPRPARAAAPPARRPARSSGATRVATRAARSSSRLGLSLLRPTLGATGSAGQLAVKVMGWGLGLSLLYLLLTKGTEGAPGKSGVEQLFGGVSAAVRGLVSANADPLSPATWHTKPAAAPTAPPTRPASKPRPAMRPRSTRQPVGAPR